MIHILTVVGVLACALCSTDAFFTSPFWPQPQTYSIGTTEIGLSTQFQFKQAQSEQSSLLQRAIDRYQGIYDNYRKGRVSAVAAGASVLDGCDINVTNIIANVADEKSSLDLDVDESYTINIGTDGSCTITSVTVWGALHSLETFSQLLKRTGDGGTNLIMGYAPVSVTNSPRWSHRGLLIDTARHYLPLDTIKIMIDTLPMANMNVLHWHMVDGESFPVDSPSSPLIDKGAFTPEDIYTMNDIKDIDTYATDRGVRIIYEIDGPGHAASWGKGYPDIIPTGCMERYIYNNNDIAVNPTLNETYNVLTGILTDIVTATNTKYLHLGGDEVIYGCWKQDPTIATYMQENNIATYPDLLGLYVEKAQTIARNLGTRPIQWEDTFIAGIRPHNSTIFDVWTNSTAVAQVTNAGYQVIAAPSDYWYLDHCTNTWKVMYNYDPDEGLTSAQQKLIVGGETSMWGEMVDEYNIQTKVWPTAAAVAERLWSSATTTNITDATNRLNIFVCRMNARGFYVGPINPGYCATKLV
jgi:hexosaminidase